MLGLTSDSVHAICTPQAESPNSSGTGINLISMPMYASRHANSVFVPRRKGTVEVFSVGDVVAPDVDIDNPKFVPVDSQQPLRSRVSFCQLQLFP